MQSQEWIHDQGDYGQLLWIAMDGADLREVFGRVLERRLVSDADMDAELRGKLRTLIRRGLLDPPGASPHARIGGANDGGRRWCS